MNRDALSFERGTRGRLRHQRKWPSTSDEKKKPEAKNKKKPEKAKWRVATRSNNNNNNYKRIGTREQRKCRTFVLLLLLLFFYNGDLKKMSIKIRIGVTRATRKPRVENSSGRRFLRRRPVPLNVKKKIRKKRKKKKKKRRTPIRCIDSLKK